MTTPHNNAKNNQIAKTVLMPGDPLRAKYIAETYLEDFTCFNKVRNMLGYTGTYKGKQVSVMGSGMGMPSIGIYSYELYKFYNVETIIRIGSCGGYVKDLHALDVVLADSCWSESTFALVQSNDEKMIQYPDASTNTKILNKAKELDIELKQIRLHSSDVFYHEDDSASKEAMIAGCSAVEMESFALFHNANVLNKKAACLCTVSDSFVHNENLSSQQREQSFDTMMKLALESAISQEQTCQKTNSSL